MILENKKYVITGGPGSGKSTLLEGLEKAGFNCSAEISRKVIQAEVARASDCLPWKDIACFSEIVMDEMTRAWTENAGHAITFFDRGIPDVIAYLRLAALPVPQKYLTDLSLHPYAKQVFILPPWKEIYVNDPERWQSFEEAQTTYESIRSTYASFGFELIELPRASAAVRVEFIIDYLK